MSYCSSWSGTVQFGQTNINWKSVPSRELTVQDVLLAAEKWADILTELNWDHNSITQLRWPGRSRQQKKTPMEFPSRPRSTVGAKPFQMGDKPYLVITDYFLRFFWSNQTTSDDPHHQKLGSNTTNLSSNIVGFPKGAYSDNRTTRCVWVIPKVCTWLEIQTCDIQSTLSTEQREGGAGCKDNRKSSQDVHWSWSGPHGLLLLLWLMDIVPFNYLAQRNAPERYIDVFSGHVQVIYRWDAQRQPAELQIPPLTNVCSYTNTRWLSWNITGEDSSTCRVNRHQCVRDLILQSQGHSSIRKRLCEVNSDPEWTDTQTR